MRVASATVLTSALLSACTGGGNDPGPTGTPPPSTTAATAPPTTSTPSTVINSSNGPNFPKGVPAAAQKQTPEGAKAFAAHLIRQINVAWTTPDPSAIEPLCDVGSSGSCRFYVQTARDLKAKGHKYEGDPVTAKSFLSLTAGKGPQQVLASLIQERRNVVDRSGKVVLTDSRKKLNVAIFLNWTESGWKASEIKKTEK